MQVIFCIGPVQDMIDVNEKALWPPARPAMQRCIKTRTVNVFKDPSIYYYFNFHICLVFACIWHLSHFIDLLGS